MSHFIAKYITIMPDKIVYVGCDNNIWPHYDGHFEKELNWENLRYLVNDLVGWCIQLSQPWWQSMGKMLRAMYTWEQVVRDDDVAQNAMDLLVTRYNAKVIDNYKRMKKEGQDVHLTLIPMQRKVNA